WVARCIESMRDQTVKDLLVFELDYGAVADPGEPLFEDAWAYWHWPMVNHADAMNFLLDQAFVVSQCDYVFNTNIDDWYDPRRIEVQLQHLKNGADLVSSNFTWVGPRDEIGDTLLFHDRDIPRELRRGHNVLCHPSIAFSRNFWRDCSRYRNDELPAEDLALWQREMHRCKYVITPEVLCFHRHHSGSVCERSPA
ncbi:MAG: hypothetical protein KGR26_13520, partial [Cyanobacteria bacterium REEB65]|nr:hypothetical protein [Cyanobacteria bacterium REEB65]